ATGRYNILLKGECRVRIDRERPTDTLYRVVAAQQLTDVPPAGDVGPLLGRIRGACGRLLRALDRPADLLDTALADPRPRAAPSAPAGAARRRPEAPGRVPRSPRAARCARPGTPRNPGTGRGALRARARRPP